MALASFCEALRIREKAWADESNEINTANHPLIVRLLNNIGCALFELSKLEEARVAFDETLCMQRELMKEDASNGGGGGNDKDSSLLRGRSSGSGFGGGAAGELSSSADDTDKKKDSHQMLLSIALTLCNLGSIHLRMDRFHASAVVFEEALLVSLVCVVMLLQTILTCSSLIICWMFDDFSLYLFRFKNLSLEKITR